MPLLLRPQPRESGRRYRKRGSADGLLPRSRPIALVGGSGRVVRGAYLGLPREEALAQEAPQDAVFRLASGSIERIDCEVAVQ